MDAYHKLLGIPPNEQPPNHYRLLAVDLFETDEEVIANAARGRCQFLRSVSLRSPEVSEPLLNEIMAAKVCLLDPIQRDEYDRGLKVVAAVPVGAAIADALAESEPVGNRAATPIASADKDGSSIASDSWMLATPREAEAANAEWIVGSGSRVAIRVRAPWVSRQHCRIWRSREEIWIEDLNSTNGTYVNEIRLEGPTRLLDADLVSLGRKTRLPWPLPMDCEGRDMRVYSIGRAPDCDCVLNDKSVSQHHAQLLIEGGNMVLQDLDSLNGTRVGSLGNRIEECELQSHESVYFGAIKVFAQDLIHSVTDG